jgi:hemerythrin
MPNSLTWRDDWAVAIDALDDEHRTLVEGLSEICQRYADLSDTPDAQLTRSGRRGRATDLVADLEHLGEQVRDHFRREEAFMRSVDYPDIAEHQCEHALLMAEYQEMVRDLRQRGETRLDAAMIKSLNDLLIPQILGADRAFAAYYLRMIRDE